MYYSIVSKDNTVLTFDCVTSGSVALSSSVVEHAVEDGSSISDHIFIGGLKMSISGIISDFNSKNPLVTTSSLAYFDANGELVVPPSVESSREKDAREFLASVYKNRDTVTVLTTQVEDGKQGADSLTYKDMAITNITYPDTQDAGRGLIINIELQQIRKAQLFFQRLSKIPEALKIPVAKGSGENVQAAAASAPVAKPEPDTDNRTPAQKIAAFNDAAQDKLRLTEKDLKDEQLVISNKEVALSGNRGNMTPDEYRRRVADFDAPKKALAKKQADVRRLLDKENFGNVYDKDGNLLKSSVLKVTPPNPPAKGGKPQ